MQPTKREGELAVELFVRSELPPPARERADEVTARLAELEAAGEIDAVATRTWDKRVPVGNCDPEVRDTYLSFTRWANEEGRSLRPFFQTREHYSKAHGERVDWLVMPAFCLAIYEGEQLSAVYPHADGPETRTVEDGLVRFQPEGPETVDQSSALAD
ncbi:HTH domain-containing protein [Halobacteriales archaeon Cl-PHB]